MENIIESPKKKTLGSEYQNMKQDREPYLNKAKEAARYTIPSLIKEDDNGKQVQTYSQPNQSVGADGVNCNDQWMVGGLDFNGGYNSLYISCDEGRTTNYGAKPNYVIAYRPFEITDTVSSSPRFRVNISFAWKGMGVRNYTYARFYFVPATKFENILNSK